MNEPMERRMEQRLHYNWPIWFADQLNEMLCQGQMVDICSNGAAFTCYADRCPEPGQRIMARFSVPQYDKDHPDSFDLANFIREANVSRVDEISAFVRRVALEFAEPLPFRPGEVTDTDALLVEESISSSLSDGSDREMERVTQSR